MLRRLFGFVAGIRPTLFDMTDMGPIGADHIGRDGRFAWHQALDGLRAEVLDEHDRLGRAGTAHPTLELLLRWIDEDQELEATRWNAAEMTLRHLDYVVGPADPDRHAFLPAGLGIAWATTLNDLTRDIASGAVTLGRDGTALIENARRQVSRFTDHTTVIDDHLAWLAEQVDSTMPSPFTEPLVSSVSRADLRFLLDASLPQGID